MKCGHCGTEGSMYWRPSEDAWGCYKCGERISIPVAKPFSLLAEYPDCNMWFSVNCGSVVSELTRGNMRVRTWVEASKTTSPWHAYQVKVGKELFYLTHTNSFDYGFETHEELKQEHYAAAHRKRVAAASRLKLTDTSPGSAMIGDIVKTN